MDQAKLRIVQGPKLAKIIIYSAGLYPLPQCPHPSSPESPRAHDYPTLVVQFNLRF